MTRFDPVDSENVQKKFQEEIEALDAAIAAVHETASQIDGRPIGGMTRVQYFTLFHVVKALKTSQAIRSLFVNGFDEDAEALLRVMVEQAIRVRWVHAEDADGRVQAFAQYLHHQQFLRLEAVRQYLPEADLSKLPLEQIEAGHNAYVESEKAKKWKNLGSVEKIAGQVNMTMSYELAYRRGSDMIHTNPIIEHDYVDIVDNATVFNAVACMPDNGLAPVLTAHHLLLIADIFNEVFELEAGDALQDLMKRIQALVPDSSD